MLDTDTLVVDALESTVCPDTVRAVADAVVRVVCPVALIVEVKKLVAVSPVVDTLVSTEVEAKMLEVKVLRNRRVEEPREKDTSVEGVVLPAIWSLSVGEVTPIPTLPFWMMEKREVPVEDATLNGLTPALPCTLKVTVEDVALTPRTDPLSISVEVPKVVAVSQRVA